MIRFVWKWFKRLAAVGVVLLILILAYAAATSKAIPPHPFTDASEPLVIAHRGGAGLWPENTLFGFRKAVEIGSDVLEFDVRATQDNVLVILHDTTVDRTTNGTGRVEDMTWEALRQLDAGYHWSGDEGESFPYRGMGLRVPSLDEVLTSLSDSRMIIELKDVSEDNRIQFTEAIEQAAHPDRKVLASFRSESVHFFRNRLPEVATSATAGEVLQCWILNTVKLGFAFNPKAETMQVPPTFRDLALVTPAFVAWAHRNNVDVYPWTINEEEEMSRLLDAGVDGMITDYPDRLLRILGRSPDSTTSQTVEEGPQMP